MSNECKDVRDALESMVWQFAHRGVSNDKRILYTGGLSALEDAFEALGWSDPKYFDEDMPGVTCDVEGCVDWVTTQGIGWEETGYWLLCHEHYQSARKGNLQPKMKQRAIDREASRGEDGRLPSRHR